MNKQEKLEDLKKYARVWERLDWGDFIEGVEEPYATQLCNTKSYKEFSELVSECMGWGNFVDYHFTPEVRQILGETVDKDFLILSSQN